jgi:hypothetical protein
VPRAAHGRVTDSDLEIAGMLLQEMVLEDKLGPEAMLGIQTAAGLDNSPAIARTTRMRHSWHNVQPSTDLWIKRDSNAAWRTIIFARMDQKE